MTENNPSKVSIVIPHYNGVDMLRDCLLSLQKSDYPNYQIVVVDNASSDGSQGMVESEFPDITLLRQPTNQGFAGGCNRGMESCRDSDYIVLFNNDALSEPDWLTHLVAVMDSDDNIGACQPKILSIKDKSKFDYSGAAGGLIDKYGFPFARGRIIGTIETDHGQYDDQSEIFWASGTACILRKSVLDEIGLLDEKFFAHMEEIDLAWRMILRGHKIFVSPKSVVYHQSGATLSAEKFRKKYFNHRNSILMVLKNYSAVTLTRILPMRILLELMAFGFSLVSFDFRRAAAIVAAFGWMLIHPGYIFSAHNAVQKLRKVSDSDLMEKMYERSIALDYYFKGKKTVSEGE